MSLRGKKCASIEPMPTIDIGVPSGVTTDTRDLGDNETKEDKLGDA